MASSGRDKRNKIPGPEEQLKEIKQRLHHYFSIFSNKYLHFSFSFIINKAHEIAEELNYKIPHLSRTFFDEWKHTYFPQNPICFSYGPTIVAVNESPSKWANGWICCKLSKVVGRYQCPKRSEKSPIGLPKTFDAWTGSKKIYGKNGENPNWIKVEMIQLDLKPRIKYDPENYKQLEENVPTKSKKPVRVSVSTKKSIPKPSPKRSPSSEPSFKRKKLRDSPSSASTCTNPSNFFGRTTRSRAYETPKIGISSGTVVDDAVPGTSAECRRRLAESQRNPLYPINTTFPDPDRKSKAKAGSSTQFVRPKPPIKRPCKRKLKFPGKSIPDIRYYNDLMEQEEIERAAAEAAAKKDKEETLPKPASRPPTIPTDFDNMDTLSNHSGKSGIDDLCKVFEIYPLPTDKSSPRDFDDIESLSGFSLWSGFSDIVRNPEKIIPEDDDAVSLFGNDLWDELENGASSDPVAQSKEDKRPSSVPCIDLDQDSENGDDLVQVPCIDLEQDSEEDLAPVPCIDLEPQSEEDHETEEEMVVDDDDEIIELITLD